MCIEIEGRWIDNVPDRHGRPVKLVVRRKDRGAMVKVARERLLLGVQRVSRNVGESGGEVFHIGWAFVLVSIR